MEKYYSYTEFDQLGSKSGGFLGYFFAHNDSTVTIFQSIHQLVDWFSSCQQPLAAALSILLLAAAGASMKSIKAPNSKLHQHHVMIMQLWPNSETWIKCAPWWITPQKKKIFAIQILFRLQGFCQRVRTENKNKKSVDGAKTFFNFFFYCSLKILSRCVWALWL